MPPHIIDAFLSSASVQAANNTIIREAVLTHFPSTFIYAIIWLGLLTEYLVEFEATTGWSVDGSYEDLNL